jgi:hypothetical protein
MPTLLDLIDAEIAQLKSVRELIPGAQISEPTAMVPKNRRKRHRKLSPEG